MVVVTKKSYMDDVLKLKHNIDDKLKCPVILLVNKIDLITDESVANYDIFYKQYGFYDWISISVKTNKRIEDTIDVMINAIIKHSRSNSLWKETFGF